jgi:hypothetical protein
MNAKLRTLVLAAVCLTAMAAPQTTFAQPPSLWGGNPYGYGTWWYARGASWEDLPYFALYPPAYCSGLTARAYGDSPAWSGAGAWGDPQPPTPQPLVVLNQFVGQKAASESPGYRGSPGPKLIKNPYYVQPAAAGDAGR